MKLNEKGFSLIELMVVVAIIGILATVAIPQYQQFQSKSRRQEGRTLLSAYYTAAKATYADLGHYPGNFVSTGFQPTGQIHARITAVDNATTTPLGHPHEAGCVVTSATCTTAGFQTWAEETLGTWIPVAPTSAAATADGTFLIVSSSQIDNDGETDDEWTLNQLKTFANPVNGLQ